MKKIVVFGNTKLAELAYLYFTRNHKIDVVAFTVDKSNLNTRKFMGLPLIPFETVEKYYPVKKYQMFVAIGYKNLNSLRINKYKEAKAKGYQLISYICPGSHYWEDLVIGDNCFIFENQVIQPNVKIGNNVIIWSGNHFGHDVTIGDNCFISSHVVISGNVKIGNSCFIGVNSTIRNGVKIGSNCIIGAGSIILNNIKNNSVLIAEPTKNYVLKSNRFEKLFTKKNQKNYRIE